MSSPPRGGNAGAKPLPTKGIYKFPKPSRSSEGVASAPTSRASPAASPAATHTPSATAAAASPSSATGASSVFATNSGQGYTKPARTFNIDTRNVFRTTARIDESMMYPWQRYLHVGTNLVTGAFALYLVLYHDFGPEEHALTGLRRVYFDKIRNFRTPFAFGSPPDIATPKPAHDDAAVVLRNAVFPDGRLSDLAARHPPAAAYSSTSSSASSSLASAAVSSSPSSPSGGSAATTNSPSSWFPWSSSSK